ncbi:MAG: hypothetical protein KDC38_19005, partial [Planctomycetes bacterium]|nr:hypothetical protein [Planctomycetota bacterium]
MVELDGWPDFEKGSCEAEVRGLKQLAQEFDTEIWLSAHMSRSDDCDGRGVPGGIVAVEDALSVIIGLEPEADHVNLRFIKTPGAPPSVHLEFDPKSMLIRWR